MARTKMTRSQRLGKQGIVFFEVDGVLARLTKKQSFDPAKAVGAIRTVSLVTPLAIQIRTRVRDQKKLAEGAWTGFKDRWGVYVSRAYANKANLLRQSWRTNTEMHAASSGANKLFSVTGGMWEGLQVRGSGSNKAKIDTQGSSVGKGATKIERRGRGGRPVLVVTPKNVRNQAKANSIFAQRGINIFEPTTDELASVGLEALFAIKNTVITEYGGRPTNRIAPRFQSMVQQIRANLRRDGVM